MTVENQMPNVGMTLDPPGTIAVVGATALGIEAALYGRFLGYNVTLIEATGIEHAAATNPELPLPMLPARSLSPLARSALLAQQSDPAIETLPQTVGQWIHDALIPLTKTDLLRGRLRMPVKVTEITLAPVDVSDEEESHANEEYDYDDDIPPDFRLTLQTNEQTETLDVEAVILVGSTDGIRFGFDAPTPYLFQIGQSCQSSDDPEMRYWRGLREVVALYAELAGRADLDLYQPRRK
jgi:hypothetical protein